MGLLAGPFFLVHSIFVHVLSVLVEGNTPVYTQCQHCIKVYSEAKLTVLKSTNS